MTPVKIKVELVYISDKKRNAPLDFPLSSPFNAKMSVVMKYFFLLKAF